jgi:hypothetical protein
MQREVIARIGEQAHRRHEDAEDEEHPEQAGGLQRTTEAVQHRGRQDQRASGTPQERGLPPQPEGMVWTTRAACRALHGAKIEGRGDIA